METSAAHGEAYLEVSAKQGMAARRRWLQAQRKPRLLPEAWVSELAPASAAAVGESMAAKMALGRKLSGRLRRVMARQLRKDGFLTDRPQFFNKTSLPPEERHDWHINSKAVEAAGYIGANDDVSGALGNFAFYCGASDGGGAGRRSP